MRDVNILRPELARHRLRHRAQSELGAGKCRKPRSTTQACGGSGEEDVALATGKHQTRGLAAGKDYEIKPFGATPQRLIAMREQRDFAGSMLGPPVSLVAKKEGFLSLGSVQQLIGPYQAAGFFTQRAWAKDHRDLLIAFLSASIEAQRWLLNPVNKQQVMDLLASQYHLAPDIAAEDYEISITRSGGFAKDAQFDPHGFENVLKLRAEVEGQWGGHPPSPDKYYDPSYYQAALRKAK